MDEQVLKAKIESILESNKNDLYKKIAYISVITEAFSEKNVKPVIVGGQAVEFYTSGGYSTLDIDVLCERSIAEIDSVLKPLGFEREGKYWTYPGSDIAIEVPSGPLAGSWDRVAEVDIDNFKAYIIGIEDIIIDRLNRYKYWKEFDDQEWIIGMIYINYDDIDWDYLYKKARTEKTIDELQGFRAIVDNKR
ncbi:DUF6036 family nucleotidyltransferase [Natronospora cellulosivora (SeqCode)]